MNAQRIFTGIIFSVLLFVSLLSCEEEQVEPPGNPADKQFIGTWSGTTNEGLPVTFYIDSIDQWTWINHFIINFYRDTVNSRVSKNNAGIAKIDCGEFFIDLGSGDNLQGKFTKNNLLIGTIKIDDWERSFSCTNEEKEININSISQARFYFGQNDYLLRQDQKNIKTLLEEHLTFFNRKYFESSLKPRPLVHDSIRLITITKGRLTDIWNEDAFLQFFAPGKRNYSVDARNGIEITIFDPRDNYKKWTTSLGSANQQGSLFEIVEMQKLENDLSGRVIIKLIAEFECTMYDYQGSAEKLTDGIFVGLFEQELEK